MTFRAKALTYARRWHPRGAPLLCGLLLLSIPVARSAGADPSPPAAQEKVGHFPHIDFNITRRQVRVECEALAVNAPLEFFCCSTGTSEHESVVRSAAKPSDIHTALLAVGLKPGEPLKYIESLRKVEPPHGPPLHISVEFEKEGRTVNYPAYRWLREVKTKREPKAFTWVFAGSRFTTDGRYAADDTGYIVTVVNFDYTLIDVPELVSNSNETLEWERNAELMPEKGAKVWMIIEPAGGATTTRPAGDASQISLATPSLPSFPANASPAAGAPATTAPATQPAAGDGQLSDVHVDEAKVQALIHYHDQVMGPRANALRDAAQAHYAVINTLRAEQQRLVTEADRIQRAIDELEKQYQDMTTPHPADEGAAAAPK